LSQIQDAAAEKISRQQNGTMSFRLQASLQSKITLDMCASKIRENEKRIPAVEFAQENSAKKAPGKNPREPKTNPRRLPPFFTVRGQLGGAMKNEWEDVAAAPLLRAGFRNQNAGQRPRDCLGSSGLAPLSDRGRRS
jgi:hypothetical protein